MAIARSDSPPAVEPSAQDPGSALKICIVGAGAIGGFIGTRLARAGADVAVLARGATADALRAHGWRLQTQQGSDQRRGECRRVAFRARGAGSGHRSGQGSVARRRRGDRRSAAWSGHGGAHRDERRAMVVLSRIRHGVSRHAALARSIPEAASTRRCRRAASSAASSMRRARRPSPGWCTTTADSV